MKNDDARNVKDENVKLNEEIWGDEHVERQGTKNLRMSPHTNLMHSCTQLDAGMNALFDASIQILYAIGITGSRKVYFS